MDCQQARHLFDAYLDGELSPSLATELGAHRLRCADCRHDLALMEVAGHVVAGDDDPGPGLTDDFANRLLACVDTARRPSRLLLRYRRGLIGGGLAAAAALAIASTVWFQRPPRALLGDKKVNPTPPAELDQAADSLRMQVETTWNDRARNARQLLDVGEMTIMQIIERLDIEGSIPPPAYDVLPDSFDELAPPQTQQGEIEDL